MQGQKCIPLRQLGCWQAFHQALLHARLPREAAVGANVSSHVLMLSLACKRDGAGLVEAC